MSPLSQGKFDPETLAKRVPPADGSLSRVQNVRRHQIMAVPMKELSPSCPRWHARPWGPASRSGQAWGVC